MQFTNNLCTFFEMQFTAKLRWMWFCEPPPLRIRRPGEEIGQIWRREGEAILYRCISPSHGPVRRYIFFLNLINLGFLLKKKTNMWAYYLFINIDHVFCSNWPVICPARWKRGRRSCCVRRHNADGWNDDADDFSSYV